jgi:hypothetical protein
MGVDPATPTLPPTHSLSFEYVPQEDIPDEDIQPAVENFLLACVTRYVTRRQFSNCNYAVQTLFCIRKLPWYICSTSSKSDSYLA